MTLTRPPAIWLILLFGIMLWGGEYALRHLWEPDEARYAYIATEMQAQGVWSYLTRHGEWYTYKPPLMFWLIRISSTVTGGTINGISARLPSLLGMVLCLWAATRLTARWLGTSAAWRVLFILPTTYLCWRQGGWGQIDALLCGLEMMALYFLFTHDEQPRLWRALAAYVFMGLAILAKGPVGMIIPIGAYLCARWAAGEKAMLRKRHWMWGPLVALLFPALWLLAAWLANAPAGYFRELLFDQSIKRVASGTAGHRNPFYYYLLHFPLEFMPWTLLLPAAFLTRSLSVAHRRLLGWFTFVFIFFSIVRDKRPLYILLCWPAAAMFLAANLEIKNIRALRWRRMGGLIMAGLLIFSAPVLVVSPFLNPFSSRLPFSPLLLPPMGLLALAGGVVLARQASASVNRPDGRRFFIAFLAAILSLELYTALVIFPALNPVKTPVALAAAAQQKLAPGQPLLIYAIKGEILAFYCRCPGKNVYEIRQLFEAMRGQKQGLAVMDAKDWPGIRAVYSNHYVAHPFAMGNKHLVWIEFDTTRGGP